MGWVAGILLQVKPFTAQLWAMLYSKGRGKDTVHTAQIHNALVWLQHLFSDPTSFTAVRHLKAPKTQTAIAVDASPFGGGSVFYLLPADKMITKQLLDDTTPLTWMATPWDEQDEQRTQTTRGEAR